MSVGDEATEFEDSKRILKMALFSFGPMVLFGALQKTLMDLAGVAATGRATGFSQWDVNCMALLFAPHFCTPFAHVVAFKGIGKGVQGFVDAYRSDPVLSYPDRHHKIILFSIGEPAPDQVPEASRRRQRPRRGLSSPTRGLRLSLPQHGVR